MASTPQIIVEAAPGLLPFVDPQAPNLQPHKLQGDTFTRADSAVTLGSAEERVMPWQVSAGSTWGISANRAYRVAPAAAAWHKAWVETGSPHHVVSATVPVLAATAMGLVARLTDADNHYHVSIRPTGLELYKVVAGVRTSLGASSLATHQPVAGDKVALGAVGDQVFVALNNALVLSVVDTAVTATGTAAGISQYDNATTPRWDNFEVLSGTWQRLDIGGRRWRDTFTRADSTTTMGSTEKPNAVAWTPNAGLVFGVAGGKGYRVTATVGWHPATIPIGSVDQEVSAVLTVTGEFVGFALRYTDINNYLLIYTVLNGTTVVGVHSSAGATYPLVGSISATFVSGDRMGCKVVGDLLSVYRNGRFVGSLNIAGASGNPRGTRVGMVPYTNLVRFDDFEAEALDANVVANRVRGISSHVGRPPDISQPADPGELAVVMDDRNRWLDPTNPTAPYAPVLGVNTHVRARLIPPDLLPNILSVDDALAEQGSGSWVAWLNCTLGRDVEVARHGRACHRLTATAAGDMSAGTGIGAGALYPVTAGALITFGLAVAPASVSRTCNAQVRFYNAANGLVSTIGGTAVDEVLGRFVDTPASQATVPATAVKAAVCLYVVSAAAAEVHYADEAWISDAEGTGFLARSGFSWPGGYPLGRGYVDHIQPRWDLGDADVTITATDAHKALAGRILPASVADVVRFAPSTSQHPVHAYPMDEDRPVDSASSLVDLMKPAASGTYGVPVNNPGKADPLMPFHDRKPFEVRASGNQYLAWDAATVLPAAPWTLDIGIRAVDKDTSNTVKITTSDRSFDISIVPGIGVFTGRTAANATFGGFIKTGLLRPHQVVLSYDGTTLACYCDGTFQASAAGVMKGHGTYLLMGLKPVLGADPAAYADTDVGDLFLYDYIRSAAEITAQWNAYSNPWGADTSVGVRAAQLAINMGWGQSMRSFNPTDDAVAPARLQGDSMLTYLRRLEATEDGSRLWVNAQGVVILRRRGMTPLASDVFGTGGKPVRDLVLDMAGEATYGAVEITPASPAGSAAVRAEGTAGAIGGDTLSLAATEHPSSVAAYLSGKRRLTAQGATRPVWRHVVVLPQRPDVGWSSAVGRDLTRRLIVKGAPPGAGAAISQLGEIIGITHEYGEGQDDFVTTFELAYVAEA